MLENQEPVAWISPKGHIHFDPYLDSVPLYTHPPQRTEPLIGCVNHDCLKCKERTWVDLTDEDIKSVRQTFPLGVVEDLHIFARALLDKAKEKNNA